MSATITKGQTFGATELVTNTKLHNLVDSATISGIAVTELATGTDGELITWSATGAAATVAVGTVGHVLTSGGAGVAPTFAVPAVPTTITVADESADTECFPLFVTAATGDLPPKSGTNLTFNSSTGALTATGFVGALTGNADTVTGLTLNSEVLTLNTGALTLTPNADDSSVLTIGSGAVTVSGSNTGDNAANSSTMYIGTTEHALNRASAAETLAGITLTTPDIGTPSAGTLTSCTGLPPSTGITAGTLPVGIAVPNGAGGTTVDAAGELCVDSTSDTLNFYDGTLEAVIQPIISKSITVEDPADDEDISLFYVDDASTVVKIVAVLTGSGTQSSTWTVRHGTDRSAAGAEVVTGGTATTSLTSGSVVTSFDDATMVADSFVWLETTAVAATTLTLNLTIFYRQDA